MDRPTVLLGMSGGVDSSVAAALLVRRGYDVHGVTLQVWEHEDETVAASKKWQERGCCKVGIARHVAGRLQIPHEVIDTRSRFHRAVIDDFLAGYMAGTTPNPCVRCNERVKLRSLIDLADARGIQYVATGHYVQTVCEDGLRRLHRAEDSRKDQSYFLYRIQGAWLPRLLFPVGALQKADVWAEAEALGLPADELKESQEICFVSHGDYRTFIEKEKPEAKRPGRMVDEHGRYLGEHEGIAFYTPGQRRGLGVAVGERLYVREVHAATNTVILGREESLQRSTCEVADLNLFDDTLLARDATPAEVKIRYATPAAPATVRPIGPGRLRIDFDSPQRALGPGQSAVFYRGGAVLGGGIIQPFA
ncbi:tRNA 2-thiouridine(34) synthase MnmA [Nitrospira moscoviensis]|uniref:tRNA-specific 2-thiouridylase MnmA n=1 Tax=Nitrospira moscoviensis TaxID=42253 RepID=A0A0K2G703_NITMO|nr:tRNA 2-thiouridine(34) synthase MnmA [Nitrospira moscoviensis]ALA56733.1 tRNA-specific 2-thiouridylase MnmA [Nitrospira moscoviensis]